MATRPVLVLTFLLLFTPWATWGDEIAGGKVSRRPALLSEEGSHPRLIVQTVPDATTTATCLAIRYTEPGTVRPPAGAAHLLEHLLFRTRLGQKPGALLLRNELLGDSCRAWVTSSAVVFSEVVPSESGLESLKLQLSRLKGVPEDQEGLALERAALKKEIASVASAEESARRKILEYYGLEPYPEGLAETLPSIDQNELTSLLKGLSLEEDVVIAVVGPHSDREVRKVLSATLAPMAPERAAPRERSLAPREAPGTIRVPSNLNQTSYFFDSEVVDLQVFRVAELLAEMRFGKSKVAMEKECGNLIRLDLASEVSPASLLADLTPEESARLFSGLRRDWLDRYESQQTRAEMFALAELYQKQPETMIEREDFPSLVSQAKRLLQAGLNSQTRLVLSAEQQPREGLYAYKSRAYRTNDPVTKEKLPNGIGVTTQRIDSFPIVSVAGFFRLSPPLDSVDIAVLKEALTKGTDMEYEVTPTGIFFHHWAPSDELAGLLSESASELRRLSEVEDFRTLASARLSLVDEFFTPSGPDDGKGKLKGSRLFQPQSSHLVVVGPFEQAELDKGLRPAWSGWFSNSAPPGFSPPKPADSVELPESKTIPLPPGSSSALIVGFSGPARSSPDFLPFNLALQTLAGRPNTSLLARKLNEANLGVTSVKVFPLTTGESNQQDAARQIWLVAVRGSRTWEKPELVVETISRLLRALGSQKLSAHELELTRDYLKSSLALSASTIRGRARVLAHSEFYRLSDSYLQDYAGLYDHLSPELVQAICRNYLEKANVRWMYLRPGNGEEAANSTSYE